MELQYRENSLSAEDFIRLRVEVGRVCIPLPQAEAALRSGLYNVTAFYGEKAVGMGRLVGDGAMYWYIQDMAVLPEFQRQGIGKHIVEMLLFHAYEHTPSGCFSTVGLMAAKGKEGFYEKLGFKGRPDNGCGAGMMCYVEKPQAEGEQA